jgi:hypothetical protein
MSGHNRTRARARASRQPPASQKVRILYFMDFGQKKKKTDATAKCCVRNACPLQKKTRKMRPRGGRRGPRGTTQKPRMGNRRRFLQRRDLVGPLRGVGLWRGINVSSSGSQTRRYRRTQAGTPSHLLPWSSISAHIVRIAQARPIKLTAPGGTSQKKPRERWP